MLPIFPWCNKKIAAKTIISIVLLPLPKILQISKLKPHPSLPKRRKKANIIQIQLLPCKPNINNHPSIINKIIIEKVKNNDFNISLCNSGQKVTNYSLGKVKKW